MPDETTFADFFASISGTDRLTDREKHFIGLAVTLTKTCEP